MTEFPKHWIRELFVQNRERKSASRERLLQVRPAMEPKLKGRAPSQWGTRPPWSGTSPLPVRRVIVHSVE